MASLTKIMTCYIVILLSLEFKINLEEVIKVTKSCVKVSGTSANLKHGEFLTIKDLLYGLMLPSGNDAALLLSEHFGKMILINRN